MELAVCRLESSPPEFTGFIRDVSEQKLAERRLAAQHAVIRTLAEAETLVEAAQKIVQSVCECLNWEAGAIWHLDEKANVLQCVDVWGSPSLPSADFINITRARVYKMGEGLPGRVWSQSKAVWIPDVLTEPNFPRGPVASQSGLHAAFGFPILVQKKV